MRKTTLVLAALLTTTSAFAQHKTPETEKLDKLPPVQWVEVMKDEINASTLKGIPYVFVLNATDRDLTTLRCDGKYELIGQDADSNVKSVNARISALKARSMTMISTNKFDGYCTKSLVAGTDRGEEFPTKLISSTGKFTDATFITIMP